MCGIRNRSNLKDETEAELLTYNNKSLAQVTDTSIVSSFALESESELAWYVAYTQPRQESIAVANLLRQSFDTYLPLFKAVKKPAKASAAGCAPQLQHKEDYAAIQDHYTYEPMFPRYVFFRPSSPKQSISTVRSTRGVSFVLMFGNTLAVIQHQTLQTIRQREQQRNQQDLEVISPFQPGSRVRLCDPALHGLEGLVQSVSTKRVMLLLEVLGRQQTVKVQHDQLELV